MTRQTQKLTVNPGYKDRFRLVLTHVPSSSLMPEYTDFQNANEDTEFFTLVVRQTSLPAISSAEKKHKVGTQHITDFENDLEYASLSTSLLLDENYYLHNLLLGWLFLKKHPKARGGIAKHREHIFVRGILFVLDSHVQKIAEYTFVDLHPVNVGEVTFDHASQEHQYLDVEWGYSFYVPSNEFEIEAQVL